MPQGFEPEQLREAVQFRRVEWQRHALERLIERHISRSDVLNALTTGELIEDYLGDRPFPSGLFFGWSGTRPIHFVAAFDSVAQQVYVITAYEPDRLHFESDYKTRRTTP